jgi:hypothetical protein
MDYIAISEWQGRSGFQAVLHSLHPKQVGYVLTHQVEFQVVLHGLRLFWNRWSSLGWPEHSSEYIRRQIAELLSQQQPRLEGFSSLIARNMTKQC